MTIRLKSGRTRSSKGYPDIVGASTKSSISSAMDANERNNCTANDARKPIAALKNNGNTCYLNSLLYVLRFTSRFLHNLHHVIDSSMKISLAAADVRIKSSSLGRNARSQSGPTSNRSSSTKDLLSSVAYDDTSLTSASSSSSSNKVLSVTEKLHELFRTLHNMEHGSKRTPLDTAHLPCSFLQAVRDANPIFITNDQQDAHELLLHLFDNLRDACTFLEEEVMKRCPVITPTPQINNNRSRGNLWSRITNKTRKARKIQNNQVDIIPNMASSASDIYSHSDGECDDVSAPTLPPLPPHRPNNNLIEDFRGVTVRSTKCLECDSSTQCTEQFYEIAVPIRELSEPCTPSELYREACMAKETLRDNNKFYCNDCRRLNEAERSISFQRLPNIMILQQKRFMQTTEGFEKITTHMPTPLLLDCFCVACVKGSRVDSTHNYRLCSIIMHVGSTMQSGHYKSYVAASDHLGDYVNCTHNSKPSKSGDKASLYFFGASKSKYGSSEKAAANNGEVCSIRNCCSIKMNLNADGCGDDVWLECNDDKITVISGKELEAQLQETSETTPYLLFYERLL